MEKSFEQAVAEIRATDTRYAAKAFELVRGGLDHTVKQLHRHSPGEKRHRHVSGAELCEGIREYALERYGVMAASLLPRWGLQKTDDFGAIVFLLTDAGVFGKTDEDTPEQFAHRFSFHEAFKAPFKPGIRLRRRERACEPEGVNG